MGISYFLTDFVRLQRLLIVLWGYLPITRLSIGKVDYMRWWVVLICSFFLTIQTERLFAQENPLERLGIDPSENSLNHQTEFSTDVTPGLQGLHLYNPAEGEQPHIGITSDATLDPETYILGPGDQLGVVIWGSREKRLSLSVDPEGRVLIPVEGFVNVGGRSLQSARDTLTSILERIHRRARVQISLAGVREFKAYISGKIKRPGGYPANGLNRVSKIVEAAGGVLNEGKIRGILVVSNEGDTTLVDLVKFFINGDLSANPYLKVGDRIVVPARKKTVQITGHVGFPGVYDFVPGDNLGSCIELVGGMLNGADTSRIVITRIPFGVDELVDTVVDLSTHKGFALIPDDRILVSEIPDYRERLNVEIRGEVLYPGVYPIEKNNTRLSEVINRAGGFTREAFLKGSAILRKEFSSPGDREFERVRNTPIEYLTPIERSFLKSKQTEEDGRISLDFSELFGDNQKLYDVMLRDGDIITIARQSTSVHVMGAVVSPGLITHRVGADVDFYVKQAGGYNTRAKKHQVTIIKAGTGIWLNPHKVDRIEAGDAVYVPEKEYRDGFEAFKDALLIIGSIATLITSSLTVGKTLNEW